MEYKEIEINKWSEFEKIVFPLMKKGPNGPYMYRGHSNSTWKLESTLKRSLTNENNIDEIKALEIEQKLLRYFSSRAVVYHEDAKYYKKNDLLIWWELMQHYGAPTRLLDWTTSPYIALYFAVCEQFDSDGSIYCLDMAHVNWSQSSRAGDNGYKNLTAFKEIEKAISGGEHTDSLISIASTLPDQRMIAQHSNLLVASKILIDYKIFTDEIVFSMVRNREPKHSVFLKYIIGKNVKKEFLMHLYYMNISPTTLFPGLDGLGKSVNELLIIDKLWEF